MEPQELKWEVDSGGMLTGFPHHDGRVTGIRMEGDAAHLEIESSVGVLHRLTLVDLKYITVLEWQNGNILGYIFVHPMCCAPRSDLELLFSSITGAGDADTAVANDPDDYLVKLEFSYGGEIVAMTGDLRVVKV